PGPSRARPHAPCPRRGGSAVSSALPFAPALDVAKISRPRRGRPRDQHTPATGRPRLPRQPPLEPSRAPLPPDLQELPAPALSGSRTPSDTALAGRRTQWGESLKANAKNIDTGSEQTVSTINPPPSGRASASSGRLP